MLRKESWKARRHVKNQAEKRPVSFDVRLSTAAGMSARFPVVSPHATLRDLRGQVLDRVVDGGLFDTSGAVTAFELAFAMRKITAEDSQSGLYPYVIQISADPQLFPDK